MTFAHWIAGHRRSVLFLMIMLALAGVASAFSVPVSLFPQVDYPRISVNIDAGDRPAEQMVSAITRPIEQAIRSVPGVLEVRSNTSRGSADVSANFNWGQDMAQTLLQVTTAINQVLPTLPPGVAFTARRMDPTVFAISAYSLTSKTRSLIEMRQFAEQQILPLLSSVPGVARIRVGGGQVEEYQIDVDSARLKAYGLAYDDIVKAVTANNVITAAGHVEDHYKLLLVLGQTPLQSIDELRHLVVRAGNNGTVELGEVARVHDGPAPQWVRVTSNGRDAVTVEVYQQPDGNTVQVVKDVKTALDAFKPHIPSGIDIATWYDQSRLITNAAASVRDAILFGVGLAALVLLAFLRSAKITLVAVIVVPAVLASTVLLLAVAKMSFNIMTLGGMAAAIGLVVDDAIVMIEHIFRRLRSGEGDKHARIRLATSEFIQPLAGSSASTIIIFIPLAFLTGVTGAFFKALALTMGCALVVSFLTAWLAVPLMADMLLTEADASHEDSGPKTRRLQERYRALMAKVLARPVLLAWFLVPLLLGGAGAYFGVGSGFMPGMDEGNFTIDYRTPPGTSLAETDRLLRRVEAIVQSTPEVTGYSRRTGLQFGGGVTEPNQGDIVLQLTGGSRRAIDEIMNEIRTRVLSQIPGIDIDMAQLMQDMIGDLTAVPQPIEIKLFGNDTGELVATAPKVADAIGKVKGVVDVLSGVVLAGDALEVQVDRTRAALEGLSPDMVLAQVNGLVQGNIATTVAKPELTIGTRVWLPAPAKATVEQVAALTIQAPDGHYVALRRVATLKRTVGQPEITRDNLKRMVAVTGRISGRDLGSTVNEIRRVLAQPNLLPNDVTVELGGLYQQQQIAFRGLIAVFVAAVGLVFLLLLFLYERFRVALAILLMPLLSAGAVFIGLFVTGIELNISAMMGMTMVIGIVTEIAIFYFSEYQQLVGEGMAPFQALTEAGANRLRPIAMTTVAAILALLPLAFAIGQGSAMQQPLAIAIISGLLVQMPLVLVVMPVLFYRLKGELS